MLRKVSIWASRVSEKSRPCPDGRGGHFQKEKHKKQLGSQSGTQLASPHWTVKGAKKIYRYRPRLLQLQVTPFWIAHMDPLKLRGVNSTSQNQYQNPIKEKQAMQKMGSSLSVTPLSLQPCRVGGPLGISPAGLRQLSTNSHLCWQMWRLGCWFLSAWWSRWEVVR